MRAELLIAFVLFLAGCNSTAEKAVPISLMNVEVKDTALHFINGKYFFHTSPLSGTITEHFADGKISHTTSWLAGKEEGWEHIYFSDGKLSDERYYHNGEKDSTHAGWWQNGNKRFLYHFNNGMYNGAFSEWYEEGQTSKIIYYTNGNDDSGKAWRQNGKLYMNFVVKDGRRYGLNNSNLCYTLKNGKGEYAVSQSEKP